MPATRDAVLCAEFGDAGIAVPRYLALAPTVLKPIPVDRDKGVEFQPPMHPTTSHIRNQLRASHRPLARMVATMTAKTGSGHKKAGDSATRAEKIGILQYRVNGRTPTLS